jgi:site-specific recombinase XerD
MSSTFRGYLEGLTHRMVKHRMSPGPLGSTTVSLYAQLARRWELAGQDPAEWIATYVTEDTPKGTASGLSAAARHWYRWKEQEPPDIVVPLLAYQQQNFRSALSSEELAAYLEGVSESGATEPAYSILRLLPRTVVRISELCNLKRNAIQKIKGSGGKTIHIVRIVGKGRKVRVIPLTKRARSILREYRRWEETQPPGRTESPYLFASVRDTAKPIHGSTVRRFLQEIRTSLPGYATETTPHILRHTAATHLHERGMAIEALQEVLGHSSIATTRRYLHPSIEGIAAIMEQLD